MPWKVYGKCVHKLNKDGSKLVKCHKSAAAARRQMRALYANEKALTDKALTNEYNRMLVRLDYWTDDAGGHELDDGEILDFIEGVYAMLGLDPSAAETVTAQDVRDYIEDMHGIFQTWPSEDATKSFNLRRALVVASNAEQLDAGRPGSTSIGRYFVEWYWNRF